MFLYPDRVPVLSHLVPIATFGKWVVIGLSFTVFGLLILARIWKRVS